MNQIIQSQPMALPERVQALPEPTVPMSVRVATRGDMPFIDALQKKHSKALGFFPRAQMQEYIDAGNVLVAESDSPRSHGDTERSSEEMGSVTQCLRGEKLGFVVSKDRYLKRDELGVIFQMCVAPGHERQFIAANLLREVFARSSYGCRLYCCWCAQDLPANRFWEAMGFVPIAYRAGGRGKGRRAEGGGMKKDNASSSLIPPPSSLPRLHIFWQKRIRAGDTSTPYWFPAKTEGGAIREDRIILPIPLDRHWSDELPRLLLAEQEKNPADVQQGAMEDRRTPRKRKQLDMTPPPSDGKVRSARQFDGPPAAPIATSPVAPVPTAIEKPRPAKQPKPRADGRLIAAARELRDKWSEAVGAHPEALEARARYDVTRIAPAHEGASRPLDASRQLGETRAIGAAAAA